MKKKLILVIAIALALMLVCAGIVVVGALAYFPAFIGPIRIGPVIQAISPNQVSATAIEKKAFTAQNQSMLDVEVPFGDVQITGGPGDQITVQANKTAWGATQQEAEAALQALKVNMTQDGDTLTIRVEDTSRAAPLGVVNSGQVDLIISVPTETTVSAHTSSGNATLNGTQGKAVLSTDFGDIAVNDMLGGLAASSRSGKVKVQGLDLLPTGFGDATLHSDFGQVSLADSTVNHAGLSSSSGDVSLSNVTSDGLVDLGSNYGEVRFDSGSAGDLTVQADSGKVTLQDVSVKGSVKAHSSFGNVSLTNVPASSYDLSSDSGAISADKVQGSFKAQSGYGDIAVTGGEKVSFDLYTKSGSVSYEGSLGDGPYTAKSDFGDIRLKLPKESAFDFDLQTGIGTITSDFALTVDGEVNQTRLSGQANGGGAALTANTQSGKILLSYLNP